MSLRPPPSGKWDGTHVALALVSAVMFAPFVLWRYPPMTDLPEHEMMVAALRSFGDEVRFPRSVYALNIPRANQLFHFLSLALSLVVPVDLACRIVAGASVAAFPLGLARLARHADRNPAVALLAAPLALGPLFRWGLVGNLLGLAGFLLALPAADRHARAPSLASALRLIAWTLVLFFAHGSAPVLLAIAVAVLSLAHGPDLRRAARALAAFAPVAALTVAQYVSLSRGVTGEFLTITALHHGWREKLLQLPGNLLGPLGDREHLAVAAVVAAGSWLLWRAVAPLTPLTAWPRTLHSHRFAAVGCSLLVCYALAPYGASGMAFVYLRFLAPGAALLLLALAPPAEPPSGAATAACAAAPAIMLAALLPAFAAAHEGYQTLDPVLARIAPGSTVVELDFAEPTGSMSLFGHVASHVVAHRGGRAHDSFATIPLLPVQIRPAAAWTQVTARVIWPMQFVPEVDFGRFRYALVRLANRSQLRALLGAVGPSAALRAVSGTWVLLESRLPPGSVDAADGPLPPMHPPTLHQRLLPPRTTRGRP